MPLLLLASCAPSVNQSKGPLRAGEVLLLTGKSASGQNVSESYLLSGDPDHRQGYWRYDAELQRARLATTLEFISVDVSGDQKFIVVEDRQLGNLGSLQVGKPPTVTACYAYPTGQGWQEAKGYLFQGTVEEYAKINDAFDNKTEDAAWNEFLSKAGRCTITRQ